MGCSNSGQLATPEMKKFNLVNNDINELINVSTLINVQHINDELTENFKPQSELKVKVKSWEEKFVTRPYRVVPK